MVSDVKMSLFIYKSVPSILALNHTGTGNYHKVSEEHHKVNEVNYMYRSNQYTDGNCKMILSICKNMPNIMTLSYRD